MKLPLVKRKSLDAVNARGLQLERKIASLKEQLVEANRAIDEILPRLIRIDIDGPDRMYNTYRICVDFHREMVERAFSHGNDDRMIRYTAERIGRAIEHKMVQFNFARCSR